MGSGLKANQFKVFHGEDAISGEELLRFFKFDPKKAQVGVTESGLKISQNGRPTMIFPHWEEVEEDSSGE